MIKVNRGKVKVEGKAIDVLAEFCALVEALKELGVPDRIIDDCVEMGKKGHKEAMLETTERVMDMLKDVMERMVAKKAEESKEGSDEV